MISVRFRHLLLQLTDEAGGNVSAAGRRIGLSQPHAKAIIDGTRNAKMETIEKAQRRVPVATRFFIDRELGAAPDYHDFLEKSRHGAPATSTPARQVAATNAQSDEAISADATDATFNQVVDTLETAQASDAERSLVIEQLRKSARSRTVTVGYVLGVLDTVRMMAADGALRPATDSTLRQGKRAAAEPAPKSSTRRARPKKKA